MSQNDGVYLADGGREVRKSAHTIRIELVDEPGTLHKALEPIVEHEGNLLSIYHERGKKSPRGRVPVEVDFEATQRQFESIIRTFHRSGFPVIETGQEQYSEEFIILLSGEKIENDVSEMVRRIQESPDATVIDVSVSPSQDEEEASGARFRLATHEGKTDEVLAMIREMTDEKQLKMIEPLMEAA